MKTFLALIVVVVFTTQEFKVKFGSVIPKDSPWETGLNEYITYAEGKAQGALKFKTYLGGQLGGEVEMIKSVAMGTLEAGGFTTAALAEALGIPELQVFELPFLFESDAEADHVMDAMFKPMSDILEKKGLMLVMWGSNGWRSFGTRHKPITKPEDLKGLKMRSQESDVYINFYKSLGATPVPISTPDVLVSLKSGMVDGFDQTPIFSISTGWTTASKHFTLSNHIYQPGAIVISKKFYDKLPPHAQTAIIASAAKVNLQKRSNKYVRDDDAEMVNSMEEISGVKLIRLTDAQREEFKKATKPVYAIMEKKIGTGIMQRMNNEIQKYRQSKK
ncbi:MAG: TRAP transporter substrate-binding protein DctP [Bacteroidetes bacterium]|nr:TRAP transporter substrate-binding protein DctP [Bacteroidota bacterium]HET6244029.1 TRAP transporter substrate-binding protein DctP [Bacteroidia bacterium]